MRTKWMNAPITTCAMYSPKIVNPIFCSLKGGSQGIETRPCELYPSETYLVVIHRQSRDRVGLGSLPPPDKDEWTDNDKVDKPVCPPPSMMGK